MHTALADGNEMTGGKAIWLGLRWYPLLLLMYAGGIAALSAHNYTSLATLFNTRLGDHISGRGTQEAIGATVSEILELDGNDMFKRLPGYERNYVPRSECLFKAVQPAIEDLLFLGRSYEELFDRFEIFYALTYADLEDRKDHHFWGPPGGLVGRHALWGGAVVPTPHWLRKPPAPEILGFPSVLAFLEDPSSGSKK
jgi:hypothetical protein